MIMSDSLPWKTQPTARRSESRFRAAIAVIVAGAFVPAAMTHGMVVETPFRQPMVDVIFVDVHASLWHDEPLDQRAVLTGWNPVLALLLRPIRGTGNVSLAGQRNRRTVS